MENSTIYVKEATNEQTIHTLENLLNSMDGLERALVDVDDGEVKVTYETDQINLAQIKNTIRVHGLEVVE